MIVQFFGFMKKIGTSDRYQNNNLKAIIAFSKFLGSSTTLDEIKSKGQITSFLDTKIKQIEEDPDKRWITTYNDYLGRIKYFYRWLHNYDDKRFDDNQFSDWHTPDFVRIKKRKTKRISPYLENELWEKEDLLKIIKYEPNKRNKAPRAKGMEQSLDICGYSWNSNFDYTVACCCACQWASNRCKSSCNRRSSDYLHSL